MALRRHDPASTVINNSRTPWGPQPADCLKVLDICGSGGSEWVAGNIREESKRQSLERDPKRANEPPGAFDGAYNRLVKALLSAWISMTAAGLLLCGKPSMMPIM